MAIERTSRRLSINEHFRREAKLPAIALAVIVVITLAMAVVGPWLFERL